MVCSGAGIGSWELTSAALLPALQKDLVTRDADDLCAPAAVGATSLNAVAPLRSDEHAEGRRHFECASDTGQPGQSVTQSRVVDERRIHEPVQAHSRSERPGGGATQHRAAIIPDQGRRKTTKTILKCIERHPAEPVEVAAHHPAPLTSNHERRREHGDPRQRDAGPLKVVMTGAILAVLERPP